jgi:hypothetical protein
MTEFGHIAARGAGVFFDAWGAGPFEIDIGGRIYRFEDSDRFGPALIKRDGDPKKHPYPPERHPFWQAWERWRAQGRRVAEDGVRCIYEWEAA